MGVGRQDRPGKSSPQRETLAQAGRTELCQLELQRGLEETLRQLAWGSSDSRTQPKNVIGQLKKLASGQWPIKWGEM